ncbi:Histone-lysine N-methyltransferase EZH1 [Fusarium oxysporum f. sp. albedinis]|nr:Histone-lysine N-methyltransferase EZH1 [Fusarium oxysporum f. sp. albedinis]
MGIQFRLGFLPKSINVPRVKQEMAHQRPIFYFLWTFIFVESMTKILLRSFFNLIVTKARTELQTSLTAELTCQPKLRTNGNGDDAYAEESK